MVLFCPALQACTLHRLSIENTSTSYRLSTENTSTSYREHILLSYVTHVFVGNGAILPRAAGNSDLPMAGDAVPFKSPPSLCVSVALPHQVLIIVY
jgi:hypothetical protein